MGKYLVIGASGDIGRQITKDLLHNNHEVIAHYYSTDIKELEHEFRGLPISFVQFDLSKPLLESPLERWITSFLDGLIYAAGTAYFAPIQDITHEAMDAQYHIHFSNLVKLTQFTLEGLKQNQHGRIVVISSIWGETGSATESIYSGMKAAQIGYIKSIAKELALTNITANIITPGVVSGKMTLSLGSQEVAHLLKQLPQRQLVQPEQVSHAVQYLLSDLAQSTTGAVHRVNGGWYI